MKLDNLNREVSLMCPTCGCTDFSFEEHDENEQVTCARCERMMLRTDLINENSELISENTNEIVKDAQKQIEAEVRKMFRNAFKGSKNFKIK
ncbi:ECs_2282 family putative zinc-binding protein [Vibrio jasicida]|uniref:ECs_2282 family putative zinc-binding protein n=1 Tax=Vibrio jasicida TaxID=766224 RepID=UPI0005771D62|nr:hypothetical protein [Vibrio jasicida]